MFNVVIISSSQKIPDKRILYNTFKIMGDSLSGTCFRISDKSKNMIVTARHLFCKKYKSGDIVRYLFDKDYIIVKGKIYLPDNPNIDIALLEFNLDYKFDIPALQVEGSYTLGQDCYFVGFPLDGSYNTKYENRTVGSVKKAIFSGENIENGVHTLYLDGININGFSGSPIIAISEKTKDFKIIGVISGFLSDSILLNNDKKYPINLGIINAVSAKHIADLWNIATQ